MPVRAGVCVAGVAGVAVEHIRMESIETIISRPLTIIQDLVAEEPTINAQAISDHFVNLLDLHSTLLSRIPSFGTSRNKLPPYSLVRFRCMIQDNGLNPEIHLQRVQMINSTTREEKTLITWFVDEPHKHPYFAVGVPGESPWVEDPPCDAETAAIGRSLEISSLEGYPRLPEHISNKIPSTVPSYSAAVIKVYPSMLQMNYLKLNEVLDVVGIIEDPESTEDGTSECDELHLGAVPILNALIVQKVPITPCSRQCDKSHDLVAPIDGVVLRHAMLDAISTFVLGDRLAAEYLYLHLFSRCGHNSDCELVTPTLNLSGVPSSPSSTNLTKEIFHLLQLLLPRVSYIPLSLEHINTTQFIPGSLPEKTAGLSTGDLQLAEGTMLVLDETKMSPGKVMDREVPTKCGCVILSHSKCMLSSNLEVPILESPDAPTPIVLSSNLLNTARKFIAAYKNEEFSISESMTQVIQTYFANVRAEEHRCHLPLTGQTDLLRILNIARLATLSMGRTALTKELWNQAVSLETARMDRVKSRTTNRGGTHHTLSR
ncbi:hypothetical protein SeMB42_g00122 [Synchytrium endobioticum]|uniref:Mini-chromosome maintenance complex-binding protein n=1 Tax=Synchytrium endobioticum TaxID=286115 RepID=A0A507DUE2_9FUNG|nr:hypothetical protein SeMB42_g00122 [Synchytrium endobioticum]